MSGGKKCLFSMLVVFVVFAVPRGLDAQTTETNVPIPNSQPYSPRLASDAPLWDTGQQARSNWVVHTKNGISSTVFLPVQSKNPKDLSAGKVLVASRSLADPNFAETVVLLVHCDADGVVGLVLNRRTDLPVSRVLDQFPAAKNRSEPVYLGGPVETQAVFALLRSTPKLDGAEQILGGVSFISTKTLFDKAISGRPAAGVFRVYIGYAGWSNDQLRMEVALGSWFIFQGDAQMVFDSDPDALWRQMIEKTELQLAGSEPAHTRFAASVLTPQL